MIRKTVMCRMRQAENSETFCLYDEDSVSNTRRPWNMVLSFEKLIKKLLTEELINSCSKVMFS